MTALKQASCTLLQRRVLNISGCHYSSYTLMRISTLFQSYKTSGKFIRYCADFHRNTSSVPCVKSSSTSGHVFNKHTLVDTTNNEERKIAQYFNYSEPDFHVYKRDMINSRGKRIACYKCTNTKQKIKPKALVFIVHGYTDHFMCYKELSKEILKENCILFGHDLEGHGNSEGDRGLLVKFQNQVSDIQQHIQSVRKEYEDLPVFVVGNSMGGSLVLATAIDHPTLFNGMVVTAPFIRFKEGAVTPTIFIFGKLFGTLFPNMELQAKKFKAESWAKDTEIQKQVLTDHLLWKGGFKLGSAVACYELLQHFSKYKHTIRTPLLLQHGASDKINSSVESQNLISSIASEDKELKIIRNGTHQLYNEVADIREEVFENTIKWLRSRIIAFHNTSPSNIVEDEMKIHNFSYS